ncbi:MAG: TetR/AcrR family transcriptional regulator [Actinomycetota bacterium]|nr:TetR/AcrR family transcriptional regulator [Actinomycetota bacterium]
MARLTTQSSATRDDTRTRIIQATLTTLREDGIVNASARAIARKGDFNQALIFYHFGSVTELLVAAAAWEGRQRADRYAGRLAEVKTLPEIVAVARELHTEEVGEGGLNVLTQLLAGSASSPELKVGLLAAFAPWRKLVEEAVERTLADTPYAGVVPAEQMAYAITALFLGIELLHTLDPDQSAAPELFDTLAPLAQIIEALIRPPT